MNKVITINLNGVAYQLEEGGYEALRAYLENAAQRLEGNPDKDEIMADIEQAVAEKFRRLLGAYKTVVNAKEVAAVLAEMGPVEADPSTSSGQDAAGPGRTARSTGAATAGDSANRAGPRRLYRIYDGAMISGVCNGLAAYLNIDVTIIRLVFTLLTLLWGAGVLAYLAMAIIVPEARTPAEKAAATGVAATAQEFIKRAKAGYYEGMRSFHDKESRRAWKRRFKQEMRGWKQGFHQQMADQTYHWQWTWPNPAAQPTPPVVGPVFVAPLLSLLLLGLFLLMFYSMYLLVTTHAVFGIIQPANMPLWVGLLIILIVFQIAAWPIKALRFSCYYPANPGCRGGPFGGLFGSLIGLFFLGFGIWMLDRHVPEFHEWLVQLPDLLHRLIDTVQGWFAPKGNP